MEDAGTRVSSDFVSALRMGQQLARPLQPSTTKRTYNSTEERSCNGLTAPRGAMNKKARMEEEDEEEAVPKQPSDVAYLSLGNLHEGTQANFYGIVYDVGLPHPTKGTGE